MKTHQYLYFLEEWDKDDFFLKKMQNSWKKMENLATIVSYLNFAYYGEISERLDEK